MGSTLLAGSLVYWMVIFGLLASLVFIFNSDYEETMQKSRSSSLTSYFGSGHDGTPYGKVKHWLDDRLTEWMKAVDSMAETIPQFLFDMLDGLIDNILYVVRGLSLSNIYWATIVCDIIGFELIQQLLSSDMTNTILGFAVFNALVFIVVVIEIYVTMVVMQKRKNSGDSDKSSVDKQSSVVSRSIVSSGVTRTVGEENQGEQKSQAVPSEGVAEQNRDVAEQNRDMAEQNQDPSEEGGNSMVQREEQGGKGGPVGTMPTSSQIQANQDKGKSLDLWNEDHQEGFEKNPDMRTEAMLAYIADCEAYDEEDLRRQNEELRHQIEQGPERFNEDVAMDSDKQDQVARLTKGAVKMLKQVRKETQFANYALDTLKVEKDVVNEELQRLLALSPEELAQVDTNEMFKELRQRVLRNQS